MYPPRNNGSRFNRKQDAADTWTSKAPFKCLPSHGLETDKDLNENQSVSRFISDVRGDGSQVWNIGACDRCCPESKKLDWGGLCGWRPTQRLVVDPNETWPQVFPSVPLTSLMHSTNIENLLYIQETATERNEMNEEIVSLINAIKVTHVVQTKDLWSRADRAIRNTPGGVLYHPGQLESIKLSMAVGHPFVFAMSDESGNEDMALVNAILAQSQLPLARPVLDSDEDVKNCVEAVFQLSNLTEDLNEIVEMTAFQTYLENGYHLLLRCLNNQGALSHQKFQMWDHFIDGVEMGAIEEVMLVPVGISWDSEGPFRRAKIVFEQPISLMEMCKGFSQANPKEGEDRLERVRFIGNHLLSTIHLIEHAQPSHILNALGVLDIEKDISEMDLGDAFYDLAAKVQSKKLNLAFSGYVKDILDVYQSQRGTTPNLNFPINVVRPFTPESVLALLVTSLQPSSLSLSQWIGVNQESAPRISKSKLISGCQFLWKIVPPRYRCVSPCQDLTLFFNEILESMVIEEILHIEQDHDGNHMLDKASRNMARNIDLDEDDEDYSLNVGQKLQQIQIVPTSKAIKMLLCYAKILKDHFENLYHLLEKARFDPFQVHYEELNANRPLTLGEFVDLGICLETIGMAAMKKDKFIVVTDDWRTDVSGLSDYHNLLRIFLRK